MNKFGFENYNEIHRNNTSSFQDNVILNSVKDVKSNFYDYI